MGSLFKLRDLWYSSYRGEEVSHTSALTVGDADNDANNENEIIFGSFSGMLRVMRPTKKGAAQPEDTLVERNFGAPILQVACRPLEPANGGKPKNLIAILFPKRLVLARLLCERTLDGGNGSANDLLSVLYRLTIYHEARLEGHAYNFVYGTFGHASHEMVCVQTMDGQLTIVNHNTVVLQCFLPSSTHLLPGCLSYSPQRDYFLTNNSAMTLMCYSFTTLTSSRKRTSGQLDENGELQLCGDAISPSWTFLLGEDIVGIEICRHTRGLHPDDADIVVLCHYTLFVLDLNGELRYSRRLDVESLCITSYFVPKDDACNLLIGTAEGSVNVYSDMSLDWSAKMTTDAPQCIVVAELIKTQGMIVSLSTGGTVAVNYLGTDPEEEPIQPLESKEADYVEMERELRQTLHAIKQESGKKQKKVIDKKNTMEEKGILHVKWEALPAEVKDTDSTFIAPLIVSNTSNTEHVGEVTIIVHVVEPIQADVPQRRLNNVLAGQSTHVPFKFTAKNNPDMIIPSSLEARAVVIYKINNNTTSHTVNATLRLPFTLVARPIPPVKNTDFVMQINTDKDTPPSVFDLFPDVTYSVDATANILSIEYVNRGDATLLISKNACRFRLQASTMEALCILFDELQRRLFAYYNGDVKLSIPDPIPLETYYYVIDTHLAVRREMIEAKEKLSRAAQMFRVVQKKLLLVFRERNPVSVGMMDVLLEESYRNIQKCADAVTVVKPRQKQAAAMLCCCSKIIISQLLIKCQETLRDPDMIHFLESIFSCTIEDDSSTDWEEVTDAILGHILQKSKGGFPSATETLTAGISRTNTRDSFSANFDSDRLKKRIGALFDQLLEGSHIALV